MKYILVNLLYWWCPWNYSGITAVPTPIYLVGGNLLPLPLWDEKFPASSPPPCIAVHRSLWIRKITMPSWKSKLRYVFFALNALECHLWVLFFFFFKKSKGEKLSIWCLIHIKLWWTWFHDLDKMHQKMLKICQGCVVHHSGTKLPQFQCGSVQVVLHWKSELWMCHCNKAYKSMLLRCSRCLSLACMIFYYDLVDFSPKLWR